MKIEIEVPEYSAQGGLPMEWEPDRYIKTGLSSSGKTFILKADRGGFLTLARLFLTLAQPNVPAGVHLHLDMFNGLDEGSSEIIITRT